MFPFISDKITIFKKYAFFLKALVNQAGKSFLISIPNGI